MDQVEMNLAAQFCVGKSPQKLVKVGKNLWIVIEKGEVLNFKFVNKYETNVMRVIVR
jgi:hypothetical protein